VEKKKLLYILKIQKNMNILSILLSIVGIVCICSLYLWSRSLRKTEELLKARLFLRYDRYSKIWIFGCLIIIGCICFLLYNSLMRPPPSPVYDLLGLIFNLVAVAVGIVFYRIVK
jgi:hypothetical protein